MLLIFSKNNHLLSLIFSLLFPVPFIISVLVPALSLTVLTLM